MIYFELLGKAYRYGNLDLQSLEFSNDKVKIPIIHWQGPKENSPVFHWAHATGFNGETYKKVLKAISQAFHVYAWDLRGHGKSSEDTSLGSINNVQGNADGVECEEELLEAFGR